MKLQGIPESVAQNKLQNFARTLMSAILPDIHPIELTIDFIHRIPKSAHLAKSVPRDVLMRIVFSDPGTASTSVQIPATLSGAI